MIQVSDAWKAGMNENTHYTTSATITLADSTELSITSDKVCVKTNRFTDGAGKSSFPVGEALSRTMQIELDNRDDGFSAYDFLGATVWLFLDYGEESITIGKFTVINPATYGETVIVTAQDDMYKADKPFQTSLTYPATAGALWAEICVSCGIPNGAGAIPQSSFTIATAPSTSLTYRAVIGYLAMLSGGNARIDRDGYLRIVNYDMDSLSNLIENDVIVTDDLDGNITVRGAVSVQASGGGVSILSGGTFTDDGSGNIVWSTSGSWDVHNLNMWHSLKVDKSDVTITGVSTTILDSDGNSTEFLAGTDDYVISLSNPLWAGSEQAAITTVKNAISGVPFRAFSGEYIAYPLAEFGDLARVTDRKGNVYYSIVTDIGFTWASNTVLKNSAQPPVTSNSTYSTPTTEAIQAAAKLVGAEKNAREQAVSALAAALANSAGMYETTEAAQGGGTIYYLHDKPTKAASTVVLKLTASALGISTDGGQTYPTGWDFATGTTITNILNTVGINADWINTGTLTVTDSNDNILFQADVSQNAVKLGLWEVTENSLYIQNSVRDAFIRTSILHANDSIIWQALGGKAVVSEGENIMFVDGISFNGPILNFTSLDGVMTGLSVPRTIWSNSSPSTSMSAQTLSISDPSDWQYPLKDPSHFNMFYIEVCWSTGYTSHRAGTWVYVPDGGSVIAHPSVDWYQGSYDAHVYRLVTIDRSAGTISVSIGCRATGSGVTDDASYAIPTRILAMRIEDGLFTS